MLMGNIDCNSNLEFSWTLYKMGTVVLKFAYTKTIFIFFLNCENLFECLLFTPKRPIIEFKYVCPHCLHTCLYIFMFSLLIMSNLAVVVALIIYYSRFCGISDIFIFFSIQFCVIPSCGFNYGIFINFENVKKIL